MFVCIVFCLFNPLFIAKNYDNQRIYNWVNNSHSHTNSRNSQVIILITIGPIQMIVDICVYISILTIRGTWTKHTLMFALALECKETNKKWQQSKRNNSKYNVYTKMWKGMFSMFICQKHRLHSFSRYIS